MTKRVVALLCLALLLIFLYPRPPVEPTAFTGVAMTVPYRILVKEPLDILEKKGVEEMIKEVFSKTNAIYNKWNPDSELSHINRAEANQPIPLSKELETLLKIVDQAWHLTGGRFDPTIESAQKVWRASLEKGSIPNERDFSVGWDKIVIENGHIVKKDARIEIDLGGIAKGYTLDLLLESFKKHSYTNVLIEWGGDFVANGFRPDLGRWRVGIKAPRGDQIVECVELSDEAFATSGDYLQCWDVDQKHYCHIFDPTTKAPLERVDGSIASVTVRDKTGAMADAFATALMLFPNSEAAEKWLAEQTNGPAETWLIPNAPLEAF